MKSFPAEHPIWKTINTAVVFAGATLFLWLNASHFDETEIKAIAGIMATSGGWNWIQSRLERKGSA